MFLTVSRCRGEDRLVDFNSSTIFAQFYPSVHILSVHVDLPSDHSIHLLDSPVTDQTYVLPWLQKWLETHIDNFFHFKNCLSCIVISNEVVEDNFSDLHDRDVGHRVHRY